MTFVQPLAGQLAIIHHHLCVRGNGQDAQLTMHTLLSYSFHQLSITVIRRFSSVIYCKSLY